MGWVAASSPPINAYPCDSCWLSNHDSCSVLCACAAGVGSFALSPTPSNRQTNLQIPTPGKRSKTKGFGAGCTNHIGQQSTSTTIGSGFRWATQWFLFCLSIRCAPGVPVYTREHPGISRDGQHRAFGPDFGRTLFGKTSNSAGIVSFRLGNAKSNL